MCWRSCLFPKKSNPPSRVRLWVVSGTSSSSSLPRWRTPWSTGWRSGCRVTAECWGWTTARAPRTGTPCSAGCGGTWRKMTSWRVCTRREYTRKKSLRITRCHRPLAMIDGYACTATSSTRATRSRTSSPSWTCCACPWIDMPRMPRAVSPCTSAWGTTRTCPWPTSCRRSTTRTPCAAWWAGGGGGPVPGVAPGPVREGGPRAVRRRGGPCGPRGVARAVARRHVGLPALGRAGGGGA